MTFFPDYDINKLRRKHRRIPSMKQIVLAGGCFWGVEAYFRDVKGVTNTDVGYANGNYRNPSYEDVCNGKATHAEATLVVYDESKTNLVTLLEHFFRIINPHTINRQGNDIGVQYRTGIYYENNEDQLIAESFIAELQKNDPKKITVSVEPLRHFDLAEDYHQDYLVKKPNGYCHINLGLLQADEKNETK